MSGDDAVSPSDGEALGTCSCKVGRSASRYGLDGLDADLVERWVGEDSDSLRDLEAYVNTELVRAALERVGESVLQGEADNYYQLLTDDETTEGTRVEARRRLERNGVDVDELVGSFVSHQTIHTHLRQCLDVTYDRDVAPDERVENARAFLQSLQRRTERITTGTLEQLRDAEVYDLSEFSVYVDLMVSCDACGRVMALADVFENGGCVCQREE